METQLDRPDPVGLSHLGLSVSNLERSISFYCDVLGATLARTPYEGDSPAFSGRMALVIIGSLILDLFEHIGNGGRQFDPTSTGLDGRVGSTFKRFNTRKFGPLRGWA
jgi:catechol 2,3-dioxygenase-like lactoylglutathione lyase family enzyme